MSRVTARFDDNWSMNQHRDLVSVGDTIFLFISGASTGSSSRWKAAAYSTAT
jgi:hypothetical protein